VSGAARAGMAVALGALAGGAVALNRALVGVFYDDGLYAGLARALATGHGYVHLHLPGAPAAIHFPPLYPLVLAPLFGLLPLDAAAGAAKVLNLLLSAATAGLITWHAVRSDLLGPPPVPRWIAPAVVLGASLAIPVLAVQSVLFAEPLFALLLAATVILADRPPRQLAFQPAAAAGLAGAMAALALLTRSIGIALGVGVVAYLTVVRRLGPRPAVAAAAPVLLAAALWGTWTLRHAHGIDPALAINYGSYGEVVRQTGLGSLGSSLPDLPRPLAAVTLGWLPGRMLYWLFALPALMVGVYGLAVLARRSSIGLALAGYMAILAVWPFPPDRFLWAVLPWLGLAWAAGAAALWRFGRLRLPLLVVAGAATVGFVKFEVTGFAHGGYAGAAADISANFRELLPWLETLPRDAVLATDDEALVWLYADRAAVPFYLYGYRGRAVVEPSPAEQRAYLERQNVTHIVLASPQSASARELRALIAAYPDWLTPVHAWPGGRWVYAMRKDR
jgi:hypothetical protein